VRVGIDLDGVCYDFSASVREFLVSHHEEYWAHEHCPPPARWEFYEDWGMDLSAFLAACHDGVDAGVIFTHGEPYANTAEAFERIKAAGHTIHIVTDRSFGTNGASEGATRAWLDCHGLPFDSLTFTSDKTIVRIDAMIDDKPANYHALEAVGVDAYLLTRPWNQHVEGAQRVLDLLHFAEVIA
jgi:hypothetical protein